ncbi:MAG TPA: hypothetical protein VK638_27780 [Edaphobacter sp.]|nr:hypothetical protein [Edaphobacter sp.]
MHRPGHKGGSVPMAIVHSDNLTTDPRKGRTSVFQFNFKKITSIAVFRLKEWIGWRDAAGRPDSDP